MRWERGSTGKGPRGEGVEGGGAEGRGGRRGRGRGGRGERGSKGEGPRGRGQGEMEDVRLEVRQAIPPTRMRLQRVTEPHIDFIHISTEGLSLRNASVRLQTCPAAAARGIPISRQPLRRRHSKGSQERASCETRGQNGDFPP